MKKIINIFGNNGSGKSIISILLANTFAEKNLKVLLIDSNIYDNSIYKIFNKKVKNNVEKIEKIYLSNKYLKKEINKFNLIIFDNPNINFLKTKDLLNNSMNIFLTESNLLGVKKLNNLIDKNTKEVKKENIKIIFNKYNKNSIDYEILKKLFTPIKVLGRIKYNNKIENIINKGRIIKLNSINDDLLKIIKNIKKEYKIYGNGINK